MCIEKTISELDFCSCEKRVFNLDNKVSLPYFCCKKTTIDCKGNKPMCGKCKEIVAKYIIFDLTEESVRKICNDTILRGVDQFLAFQEEHLSKMFFYEHTHIRYNIYLMFVSNDETPNMFSDEKFRYIESDLDFARKLFFTEKNFREFFTFFTVIAKRNRVDYYEKIKRCVDKLHKEGIMSILIDGLLKEEGKERLFNEYLELFCQNKETSYDELALKWKSSDVNTESFMAKFFPLSNEQITYKATHIKHLDRIVMENFRPSCFQETKSELAFGLVNIISGVNTSGKTSLLESIEFALTGSIHNDGKAGELAEVIVANSDGKMFSSKISEEENILRKRAWYPNRVGTLNELFCRINHFDTDAAYRFALEQSGDDSANYLLSLFCDAELFAMANRINWFKKYIKSSATRDLEIYNIFMKVIRENGLEIPNSLEQTLALGEPLAKLFRLYGIANPNSEELDVKPFVKYMENLANKALRCVELLEALGGISEIREAINEQIAANIEMISMIFKKLHSYEQFVKIRKNDLNEIVAVDAKTGQEIPARIMSTAQRVCLALSVIFAQFLSNANAPKFVMLDESVANFDSYHLLNLIDFLKELAMNGVQVFFTTASTDIASIVRKKFDFLGENLVEYTLTKDADGKSKITPWQGECVLR